MATLTASAAAAAASNGGLTPTDLAELMASFSEVTAKLERTHRQLREEVGRLNEELAEKDEQLDRSRRLAALGEMAAGIAHEIRNPLGSIGLYARLLMGDLGESEAGETARKIAGGVRRLDEIVGDVLSFSRELRVRPAPCEVTALFDGALELSVPACDPRPERRPRVVRSEARSFEVVCDASLVERALANLIRNAADAMGSVEDGAEPGVLTLSARRVAGRGRRRGSVVLGVSDTGPGIEPAVIERMFNPFFTTRETGTGLGLAIVHRIADAHGGRVEVFNNAGRPGMGNGSCGACVPGRGATVELHLPQPSGSARGVGRGVGGSGTERGS